VFLARIGSTQFVSRRDEREYDVVPADPNRQPPSPIDNGTALHQNRTHQGSARHLVKGLADESLTGFSVSRAPVMLRLGRYLLLAGLLTIYGSVGLCGVSLHTLLEKGLAHHDHGPIQGTGATLSGVYDDCPLCEFFSHGQLPIELPRPEARPLVAYHRALAAAPADLSQRYTSCHPRAPPSIDGRTG
jgi:hypothetical protein